MYISQSKYKCCIKSNTQYFITLAHYVKHTCWCYDCKRCSSPTLSHFFVIDLLDRNLVKIMSWMKAYTKQRHIPLTEKLHPLTFKVCSTFMETTEWMWTQAIDNSRNVINVHDKQHLRQWQDDYTDNIFPNVAITFWHSFYWNLVDFITLSSMEFPWWEFPS